MDRREFLQVTGATLTGLGLARFGVGCHLMGEQSEAVRESGRPNFLIIMTDQQFAGAMGCLGVADLKTPAMDSLARTGVVFDRTYCADPLCVPSRSSMFSGRMPHEVGAPINVAARDGLTDLPFMGAILGNAGYQCAYTGKWHLPVPKATVAQHGFTILPGEPDAPLPPVCDEFFRTPRDRPFLLVASFMNPHNICQWARGDALPQGAIGDPPPVTQCPPLVPNAAIPPDEPAAVGEIRNGPSAQRAPQAWTDDHWRQYRWAYHRMIELVDGHIALILDALRKAGLEENTIVIFTSDHGDGMGAHRWNQKQVLYEESVRVPFIVSLKGVTRGGLVDRRHLVSSGLDLIPTLCDYAGVAPPANALGHSIRPLAEGREPPVPWRDCVFAETEFGGWDKSTGIMGRMARTARYKYIVYNRGDHREQLFDMDNDPGEMKSLAASADYVAILRDHRARLATWLKQVNDDFAVPES